MILSNVTHMAERQNTPHSRYNIVLVTNTTSAMHSYTNIVPQYKGILAGMRPCGTIVLLGELFGSKSVSGLWKCPYVSQRICSSKRELG